MLGVDIHFEMVPMPALVPTPIPNPFVGMAFDPAGLLVGQVMRLKDPNVDNSWSYDLRIFLRSQTIDIAVSTPT